MRGSSAAAVAVAVEIYFQALHEGDVDKFDTVFHSSANLIDVSDGFKRVLLSEFREKLKNCVSPASAGKLREDELIFVDFVSKDIVVAKVRSKIDNHTSFNHLSLVRVRDRFMIVAKTGFDERRCRRSNV